jgi:DNA-binding NtrC family response regulator
MRREDIPLLARHFLHAVLVRCVSGAGLCPEALELLSAYAWPGNVRELENSIERATNLATGELIQRPICLWKPDRAPRCATYEPQPAQDLSSHEMHAIVAALKSTGGNIRLAARQLNVSRGGLYNKMSRFGLNAGDFRGA